jgi:preprotein translocase subunit SecE
LDEVIISVSSILIICFLLIIVIIGADNGWVVLTRPAQ